MWGNAFAIEWVNEREECWRNHKTVELAIAMDHYGSKKIGNVRQPFFSAYQLPPVTAASV